jgi:hypothetical protein
LLPTYQGFRQNPNNQTLFRQNVQSVVAFELQYISLNDLTNFFDAVGIVFACKIVFSFTRVISIVADPIGMPYQEPIIQGHNDPTNPGGESTLDIQWVMGIGTRLYSTLRISFFFTPRCWREHDLLECDRSRASQAARQWRLHPGLGNADQQHNTGYRQLLLLLLLLLFFWRFCCCIYFVFRYL